MAKKQKVTLPEVFTDIWWLVLLQGIAALLLGWAMITRPGISFTIFVQFIGAYWLVDGILSIAKAVEGRKVVQGWGWGILSGIVSILASVVIFLNPVFSSTAFSIFLIWYIGISALIQGITSIVTGIRLRKEIDNEWSMIFGGLLGTVFGLLILLVNPLAQTAMLTVFLGFFAIAGGTALIVSGIRIRRAATKALKDAVAE